MRYVLSVLLLPALLWLPPALAQENKAEKLFRDFEKKIKAADAVQVTADINFKNNKGEEGKIKGSLLLTKDNKVRVRLVGTLGGGQKGDMLMVCDSKMVRATMSPELVKGHPTPKKYHNLLSALLTRAGVSGTFFLVTQDAPLGPEPKEINADEFLRVTDFKAGAVEKVGDRDAKVVKYNATIAGKDKAKVTLWIDAKTELPLKRDIVLEKDGTHITETYTAFRFDPKIEAKAFELSK